MSFRRRQHDRREGRTGPLTARLVPAPAPHPHPPRTRTRLAAAPASHRSANRDTRLAPAPASHPHPPRTSPLTGTPGSHPHPHPPAFRTHPPFAPVHASPQRRLAREVRTPTSPFPATFAPRFAATGRGAAKRGRFNAHSAQRHPSHPTHEPGAGPPAPYSSTQTRRNPLDPDPDPDPAPVRVSWSGPIRAARRPPP